MPSRNSETGGFTAFNDRYGWEADVVERAVYFTTVRFLGRRTAARPDPFDKRRFDTLSAAIADAGPEKDRVMVYAVTAKEESSMLARKDWPRYLKLRGEAQ